MLVGLLLEVNMVTPNPEQKEYWDDWRLIHMNGLLGANLGYYYDFGV